MSSTAPSNTNRGLERDVPANSIASDASDAGYWDAASAQDSSSDGETSSPEPLVTERTKLILATACCSDLCLGRNVEASTEFLYGYIGMSKENQRTAPPPLVNKEKVVDLHNKILQYVPPQYRDDPLYLAPSEQENQAIRAKKRTRRTKTEPE
ncbi:hypothetical protein GN244_ATG04462 [Phytophthora infestans]|uniref:Uncharacterized protein n=1 Tax=Phytophthora infestans TaxID=4787 RepID=A0A833WJI0_PHYIN|nr:hypothetical protein GN244_ATG04462 [Phytophthora infestans]